MPVQDVFERVRLIMKDTHPPHSIPDDSAREVKPPGHDRHGHTVPGGMVETIPWLTGRTERDGGVS